MEDFEAVDQNGDGVVSKQEFFLAFENLSRNHPLSPFKGMNCVRGFKDTIDDTH